MFQQNTQSLLFRRISWLHEATAKVFDQFVMLLDIPEAARGVSKASATPIPKKQFPCRME